MFDKFHEECGVVGVYGHPEAATLAYLSLYALQHRGQESAGIVASNGEALIAHRGMGHVAEIFSEGILARLEGRLAIGHNRYSTTGTTVLKNCQPFVVEWAHGALAMAHNGNLVNADSLRAQAVGVHEVAVVGHGERAVGPLDDEGLTVLEHGGARGGVPVMADRETPLEASQNALAEDLGDVAHPAMGDQRLTIGGDDAGRLLAAVLQRVQREVGKGRGLGVAVD